MVVWLWFGLVCLLWIYLCCGVGLVIVRVVAVGFWVGY